MGEIRIDIPADMERAFDDAFPDHDKATAVLRLIREEIERRRRSDNSGPSSGIYQTLVAMADAVRALARPVSQEEIRQAREKDRR